MVLSSYDGTYQILDNHNGRMFVFQYYYTVLIVLLKHFVFEMRHKILDMDNIYVYMIFLIRMTHPHIVINDYPSIIY